MMKIATVFLFVHAMTASIPVSAAFTTPLSLRQHDHHPLQHRDYVAQSSSPRIMRLSMARISFKVEKRGLVSTASSPMRRQNGFCSPRKTDKLYFYSHVGQALSAAAGEGEHDADHKMTNSNEITSKDEGSEGDTSEKPATDSSAASTSSSSSETKISLSENLQATIYMSLLALQFGLQPTLVKKYTPQTICRSTVVLMQELVKCVIACSMYFTVTTKEHRKDELDGWNIKKWLAIAALPAGLYTMQNLAALLAYQNLEPLTFNVLNQTKTLSAALCCYLVMRKKQSKVQMVSLILLLLSALVIERIMTLDLLLPPYFGSAAAVTTGGSVAGKGLFCLVRDAFTSFKSMELTRHVTHGVLPILLASFLSGLAGAITQKNLQGASRSGKKRKPRNAYLFSLEMNVASAIILIASMFFSVDGKRIAQSGFFDQWTPRTFIPVVTNALGGIIVGLVTKYAGSVRKGFALIFGILISGLVQAGSAGVTAEQIVGGVLAALSLWLHTAYPYKPRSSTVTPPINGEEQSKT